MGISLPGNDVNMQRTQLIPTSLLDACIQGDRKSQKRLYELLLPYLNAIVRRYLCDARLHQDALQEAFINVFTGLKTFDPAKGTVKQWAARVTIHAAMAQGKKAAKRDHTSLDDWDGVAVIQPVVLDKLSNDDLIAHLRHMPPQFFEAFSLHVIDGFEHKEVAQLLGITPELARQRVSRARKWVRTTLQSPDESTVTRHINTAP